MADHLTPAQRVALARHQDRPGTADFIAALFTDFFEQRGDRLCADDGSILGGVALFHGQPVTVIGHWKVRTLEEHLAYHFGIPSPEGFAAILWKDSSRSDEACDVMKLTATDLLELGVIDAIIPEPPEGTHTDLHWICKALDAVLVKELAALNKMNGQALATQRYKKFRLMGSKALRKERP